MEQYERMKTTHPFIETLRDSSVTLRAVASCCVNPDDEDESTEITVFVFMEQCQYSWYRINNHGTVSIIMVLYQ